MNGQLNGLVGGVETVTVGDMVAAKHGGRKTLAERAAAPTFDVVVMMRRGARHEEEQASDYCAIGQAEVDDARREIRRREVQVAAAGLQRPRMCSFSLRADSAIVIIWRALAAERAVRHA